jgi:hypothetical protein
LKRFKQLLLLFAVLPLCAQDAASPWPAKPAGGSQGTAATLVLPEFRSAASGWWIASSLMPSSALDLGIRRSLQPLPAYHPGDAFQWPWLRTGVSFVLPGLALKPCIGFAATIPLVVPVNDPAVEDPNLKLLVPRSQVGIYGGIRF